MRISTNLPSINAQTALSTQSNKAQSSMRKLASGSRITRASDDAAGLAISENLKAQTRGNRVAKRNAEDAISLVQVGEGGLNEINNILVRMRELGVQSASDTVGDTEREFIDTEAQQLMSEIDRIAESTRFGDKFLLNGTAGEMDFQVGAFGDESSVIRHEMNSDATASSLNVSGLEFDSKGWSRDALEVLDNAINSVGGMRASFGALQNRLDSTISNLDTSNESLSAANSRIRDVDMAEESAKLASYQVLQQASTAMLAQANQSTASALSLL